MKPVSLADKTRLATSTLFLVPPSVDRRLEGRRLAAPLVGGTAKDQDLAMRGVHPDIIELAPPEKKERIGIAQVREAIRSAQFSPAQGERKVCVVFQAEAMTPEAANALLKTLEEPPREMAFVLLAGHAGDLLPTIVSRSRVVRLAPADDQQSAQRLIDRGYPPEDAWWLVSVATRPGELERFSDRLIDIQELQSSAEERAFAMNTAELVAATLDGESVLRRAALRGLLTRAASGDPEILTDGVRTLSGQERDAINVWLQDLLAAAFEALRQAEIGSETGPQSLGTEVPVARMRIACVAIDRAHRALSVYAPTEAVLLRLLLAIGSGFGGDEGVS